jgi:thioredoxin-like negative regulator of GroEL
MNPKRRNEPQTASQQSTDFAANGGSSDHALARAVSLHLEGKPKEALRELEAAFERGEESTQLYSARGHLQFELEQFEEAARS